MSLASEERSSFASPLISVIIPACNVEKYLRRCLDSVFAQTLDASRMEVICVDDGSTDATPAILSDYAASHSNLIVRRQENAGSSAARNQGLAIATGEYVLFMDSDDWLSRADALELLCARAVEMRLDELIFCGDAAYEDDPKRLFVSRPRYFLAKYDYERVTSGQDTYVRLVANDDYPIVVWRRPYRRAFLMENDLWFIPGIVHQDQVYTRECAALAERVNCWDFACYTYYVRANSISSEKKKYPYKSIYSRLVGIRHLRTFARERLTDASPEFVKVYRLFTEQWSDVNARQYLQLSQNQRNDFWRTVPDDAREQLRGDLNTAVRDLYRRRLNRFLHHPVQRLRSVMQRRGS